jgi:LysR family glycine cleavage system transcriptional activator
MDVRHPPRRLPPLNALRAFEVAARHESFVAAASELRVTPAAISRHVKLLEARLKQPLFERRPQSLKLTAFGHSWLPTLSEAFDIIEMGTQRLQRPQPSGKVTVSAQTAFATGWLLPRLDRLYRDLPDMELRLYTHTEQPDLGADSRFDGVISNGRGNWPQCEAHFIFADRLVPVCSPSYVSACPTLSKPKQLISETLIVAETAPSDWPSWFAHVGMKVIELPRRVVFPTGFLPVQAAMNGIGVALADQSLIEQELESRRLIAPIAAAPLVRGTGWYFIHPQGCSTGVPLQRWIAWLQREGASQ